MVTDTEAERERIEPGVRRTPVDARRAATIIDVAREAAVSKSTVSRVLTGSQHVAVDTRDRVLAAVSRLDYHANSVARGLRTTRSFLVGLLVPAISNDIFSRIAEVVEEDLRHERIGLVIVSSGWDPDGERVALESLRGRRVDCLVGSFVNDHVPGLADVLHSVAHSIVLIDREVPGVRADVVLTDQSVGIGQAVEHLAGLGHRRVGLATLTLDVRPGRQAALAFRAAVAALALDSVGEVVVTYDRIDRATGTRIAQRLLAAGATAILCCVPNVVTAGVLEYLDDNDITVPADVSVIAFDESELASVKRPRLTVVSRPIDDLARRASRMVTTRLAHPDLEPRVDVVTTELRVRGSTAAPRELAAGPA